MTSNQRESKMLKDNPQEMSARWRRLISFFLILFVAHGVYVYWYKLWLCLPFDSASFQLTEILISYRGGFVRRGFLGELLYQTSLATGVNGLDLGCWICLVIYLTLFGYFVVKFKERHLCWWLLCCPLMFGLTQDIVRKDFMLMWVSVGIYLLLRDPDAGVMKRIGAGLLAVFALLMHEAYIFWGIPLMVLLMLHGRHKVVSWGVVLTVAGVFVLMCVNKGSATIVRAIVDSWNNLLPARPLTVGAHDAINALGWDPKEVFIWHFHKNIGYDYGSPGLLWRPIPFIFAYYIGINFLYTFRRESTDINQTDRTNIGMIYLMLLVCLLPMLTVLSCDFGRTQQFAFMTVMTAFLVLSRQRIEGCFPLWYRRMVSRLNSWIDRVLPPSRGWLLVLLFLWGESRAYYDPNDGLKHSVVGGIADLIGWFYNSWTAGL